MMRRLFSDSRSNVVVSKIVKKYGKGQPVASVKKYVIALAKLGLLFTYFRIAYLEWLYVVHLRIRKAHDKSYQNIKWYKDWSDKSYSEAIHRAVMVSFVLSFAVFSVFQTMFPYFQNPQKALADSRHVMWTTKADFENNASTTNSPTLNDGNIVVTGVDLDTNSDINLGAQNLTGVKSVSAGQKFTLALMLDGTVKAWGYNGQGQLGNGTNASSTIPVNVSNLTDVKQISAGVDHSAALKEDGTVWVWGEGGDGELGNGTNQDSNIPVQVTDLTNVRSVAAGYYYTLAVKNDDTLWVWGANWEGYLGNGTFDNSNLPIQSSISDVKTAATGNYHSIVLKNNGDVWAWGYGAQGQLGDGLKTSTQPNPVQSQTSGVSDIIGWGNATAALKNGTVLVFGEVGAYLANNGTNQVAIPTLVSNVADVLKLGTSGWGSHNYGLYGFKSDNKVWEIEESPFEFTQIAGAIDMATIVEGNHGAVVMSDNTVKSWGSDSFGQLGDGGNNENKADPVFVTSGFSLTGSLSGLKATTGGPVASWNDGSIYADIPTGAQVDVYYRVANSEVGLSETDWYYQPAFSCLGGCGSLIDIENSSTWSLTKGSWIEFKIDFFSNGSVTPVVHDFSLSYDAIDTPQNITSFNKEGGGNLQENWANESSVLVKADVDWFEKSQYSYWMGSVELSISDGSFEHNETEQVAEGITVNKERLDQTELSYDQIKLAEISGLSHGKTYTYRVRVLDFSGRTSTWSNPKTIKVDLENPNLGSFNVNEGDAKTSQRTVNLNLNFNDANSGISQMRFSNDGQTWSGWENYQTEKAWNLSSGDGAKTVYGQAKDLAGNVSGRTWDSGLDFGDNGSAEGLEIGARISLAAALENQNITISTTEKNKIAVNDFNAAFFIDTIGNLYGSGYGDGLGIVGAERQPVSWQKLRLPEDKKAKEVYGNDCGDSVFVIAEDGTLYIAGEADDYGLEYTDGWAVALDQYNNPIKDIKQLSAGYDHVMIIRSDNKAWGAGDAEYNDLSGRYIKFSKIPTLIEDISQVAAACYGHSLALTSGGTLKARGSSEIGEPGGSWRDPFHTIAGGWNGVKKIKASSGHSMLEDNDGYIWATGQTYQYVGITYEQFIATGRTWIKNGIQNPRDFFSVSEGSFIINGENTIYHELSPDGTFSGVTNTYPAGSALHSGGCSAFSGDHCPAQGAYKPFDSTNTYLDFVSGWNQGLGLDNTGRLYAWGRQGNDIGFPGESSIIKRQVDNAITSFLGTGYLGSPTVGGGGLKFSNNLTLKPINLSMIQGGGSSPGMGIKIAYRVSEDGTSWSELKGRDGDAINWETNYLGVDGDINNGNVYGQIAGSDVGKYIELVVKMESDGTASPYLDSLKLETAFVDTIILETVGPEIDFDPNNKYPNENWNVKENVNSIEFDFGSNKNAIAQIDFGTDSPDNEAQATPNFSTTHLISLSNLGPNSTYKYRIRIFDELGNMGLYPSTGFYEAKTISADTGFDGSPLVSSMSQVEITASSAKITWKTKVPTSSYVDFGLDTGYGDSAGDESLNTSHVVELKNLTSGKIYHYRVRGNDSADNEYSSSDFVFKAIMNPEIFNVQVKELSPYEATITFDTNVSTDSAVNFGEGLPYTNREYSADKVNNHTIKLRNLIDITNYHYQVEVRDDYANVAKSADLMFKTPLDTEGPKISNVRLDVIPVESDDESAQIIVSWVTSKPATGRIEYGDGIIGGATPKSTIEDSSLNITHTSVIKNLSPGNSYHLRVISKDRRGNQTTSADYTLVTPAKQKSILQLILRAIEDSFSWTRDMNKFFGNIGDRFTGR